MTKPKGNSAAPSSVDKSNNLTLKIPVNGPDHDRIMCDLVSQGIVTNAYSAMDFAKAKVGTLSLTDMVESLQASGAAVNANDLSALERMLTAQAVALNAIFTEMARRAASNMGEYLDATDRYMRLGLKAQSQCRATVETLAEMKNPPVVFARQANINNGGQQQVNNGAAPTGAHAGAHASKIESAPNELSGGTDELLADARASTAAGGTNQGLESLGAFNRPSQP